MEDLEYSIVHKNLDAKMKILGLEVPDLLFVLIFGAVMNLFFGKTALAGLLVIIFPTVLLLSLIFFKKFFPNSTIPEVLKYYFSPGFYLSGEEENYE